MTRQESSNISGHSSVFREDEAILIAFGANLPSRYGAPQETLAAALRRLEERGLRILARSRFWLTEPVPVSDQPWFVNGVCAVETALEPEALLALLHAVEAEFGRVRSLPNAPRVLDLDLLAHGRRIVPAQPGQGLCLPHPRLGERAFVLLPLRDVAPGWVHPCSGDTLLSLIARLPADQKAVPA